MKTLALFDFDHTLYKKDSLLEFTKFSKGGLKFYWGILILSPYLILMKLNLQQNELVKKKYLSYFFLGMEYSRFLKLAENFSLNILPKNIDHTFFKAFLKHYENGDHLYIVTASFAEWISAWAQQYDATIISTKLEVKNNTITGNLLSKNCNGIEKVDRIKQEINLSEFNSIVVYGKGKGDYEMLKLAKS